MNQNISYSYDPRSSQQQQNQVFSLQPGTYHSTYTTSTSAPFHTGINGSFIQTNQSLQQRTHQPQSLQLQVQDEDKRLGGLMETYFIEPSAGTSSWTTTHTQRNQPLSNQIQPQISYQNGNLIASNTNVKNTPKLNTIVSPDKAEKERAKKARQAEAARQRYHRLTPEEKRELNLKRTQAQKRKRQREKELEELDNILRETNDIQEDPDITEQLREKRMRAKWAEAARARYARMTPEERRAHNNRRRMRQMQNALQAVKRDNLLLQATGGSGDPVKDEEAVRQHIKSQNAKKAEAARARYHRMSEEEKRSYNQRRTEAFRRRRMEEEMLLAMPIGRINGEALDRAQQIVVRNAKRAEAARARYQRMTPDQRKSYNQKRYTPKKRGASVVGDSVLGNMPSVKKDEMDALSTLERDVIKRTQQAQQIIMRQNQRDGNNGDQSQSQNQSVQQQQQNSVQIVQNQPQQVQGGGSGGGSYIIQPASQGHLNQQGQVHQLHPNGHQQVVHVTQQMGSQQQFNQQQGFQQPLNTSQSHVVIHHPPTSHVVGLHQQPQNHQVTYSNNGMMINSHVQQQVLNPYGAPQRN